jgi:hypothetical protein
MRKGLSVYQQKAYDHWDLNAKEHGGIPGDGPFAVVCCDFFHPSARDWCLGEVYLAETVEKAQQLATAAYCHASSKGLCKGKHKIYSYDQQAQTWKFLSQLIPGQNHPQAPQP